MEKVMCDYSLHAVASRPAKVGERLISTTFRATSTRGFAALDDPNTAVCLLPGTELAFDQSVQVTGGFLFKRKTESKTARFRELGENHTYQHHDALEMADGQIFLVTDLFPGQYVTVLQLPVSASEKPRLEQSTTETERLITV
jgi:hypothetical protein